jgi:hypothetical protein
MQIVENGQNVTLNNVDKQQLAETCQTWDDWVKNPKNHFLQDDSGI